MPPSFTRCGEQVTFFQCASSQRAKRDQLIGSHLIAETDDGPTTDCASEAGDSQGKEMKTHFARCRTAAELRPKAAVFLFQLLQTTMRAGKPPDEPKAKVL